MTADLATLPALKGLGDLAGLRPVLVTDTREQLPLPFKRLASVRATLTSGDYSFRGGEELFAVERKSIADLVGCCVGDNRERFFRELHRLRGYRFKRLLVVGTRDEIEATRLPLRPIAKGRPCHAIGHRGAVRHSRCLRGDAYRCGRTGGNLGVVDGAGNDDDGE
jgi:hypothetical protein